MIGSEDLRWDNKKLYHKDKLLVELIPHETYEKHWHLKFYWRDEKTPEFFNIINAKENSRVYALQHLNYDTRQKPAQPRTEV